MTHKMNTIYSFFSVYVHVIVLYTLFFFFNDPETPEIYTLSLHDALPICRAPLRWLRHRVPTRPRIDRSPRRPRAVRDRKSTRLNSSHVKISYAVFCLKKKKNIGDSFDGMTIKYAASVD